MILVAGLEERGFPVGKGRRKDIKKGKGGGGKKQNGLGEGRPLPIGFLKKGKQPVKFHSELSQAQAEANT